MNDDRNSKRLRLAELILVLSVAFAPTLFISIYIWLKHSGTGDQQDVPARMLYGLISELASIAVLKYVLFRQGRRLRDIGFVFSLKDIPISVMLAGLAFLAFTAAAVVATLANTLLFNLRVFDATPRNVEFLSTNISFTYALFVLINPAYEELIARAFTMTEVRDLTNSGLVAVIVSTALQTSYHIYQGVAAALILSSCFLVFSLYYLKWRRITPVILAHFYFDLLILVYDSKH